MKAAVLREVNTPLQIEDIQTDDPAPREVLIRTGATGVCHSDLHYVEGKYKPDLPLLLGHEPAGTVEAVGQQVSYVKPGDKVIVCLSVFCGHCDKCLSGHPNLCRRTDVVRGPNEPPRLSRNGERINQFAEIGSFAEQMLVHENAVVKITEDVPMEVLALIGCGVTTGVGAALNTAKIEPGSTVAVIGCGGVGLSCIQGARIGGAGRIIAIDSVETKLGIARELGATDVVDASTGDVVEKVRRLTGTGVNYSFEAIGTKQTAEQAFEILDSAGVATVIGMIPEGVEIELDGPSFLDEKRIQGSEMGSNRFRIDMPRYVQFYLQGRLKLDEMVTKRIMLEQVNQAFEDMKEAHVTRSVIVFD